MLSNNFDFMFIGKIVTLNTINLKLFIFIYIIIYVNLKLFIQLMLIIFSRKYFLDLRKFS